MKPNFKTILLCMLSATTLMSTTGNVMAVGAPINYHQQTAPYRNLDTAIKAGNLQNVINFFQNGQLRVTDFIIIGDEGQTPLQNASCYGKLDIVDWLVRQGADIEAANEDDYDLTPLTYAAMNGHWDVVRYLVLHGANVNSQTAEDHEVGHTALTKASRAGNLEMVRFLVAHGADVNIDFVYRYNALEAAVANNHLDVVRFLIEIAHAQVNIDNLIQIAQDEGATETVGYLRWLRPRIIAQRNHH